MKMAKINKITALSTLGEALVLCFLILSPITSSAQAVDGVDIISQNYSASVSWGYQWEVYTHSLSYEGSFGDSETNVATSNDGTPISVGFTTVSPPGIGIPLNGGVSIAEFSFNTSAFAGNDTYGYGSDGQYYESSGGDTQTSGQANWLFQPTDYNLQITLNMTAGWWYSDGQHLSVTLSDVTSSTMLLNYSENGSPNEYGTFQSDTFLLNPTDTYQLSISGNGEAHAGDLNNQEVTASFAVVPEPATIYLFPLGIIIFITTRKCLQIK
jgi:hypothetical protein